MILLLLAASLTRLFSYGAAFGPITNHHANESFLGQNSDSRTLEVFHPDAVVIVTSGPDGAPGIVGVDDGANGVVDDASELGATGSDDVCLAVAPDRLPSQGEFLVLDRGAFLPASDDPELMADKQDPRRRRAFVAGRSPSGAAWEMMVEDVGK